MANRVHGTPIIESFSYGKDFGRIDFTFDGTTHDLEEDRDPAADARSRADVSLPRPAGSSIDQALAAKLQHFTDDSRALKESLLGHRARAPPSPAITPTSPRSATSSPTCSFARVPDAQVGMMNGGGLRADLPAGPLHYGALFEAMPFDNRHRRSFTSRGAELRSGSSLANLDEHSRHRQLGGHARARQIAPATSWW